jgi:hypothetical protein
MSKNPLSKGVVTEKSRGIGAVSRSMVQARAHELAVIAGRTPPTATPADYDQAVRELTGGPDLAATTAALEALPESERWDPLPGSAGTETPGVADEESDDEGRNESAQLVEEGMKEAEHVQMLAAARAADQSGGRSVRPKSPRPKGPAGKS